MHYPKYKFILFDCLIVGITLYFSFLIRFEFLVPDIFFDLFIEWLPWFLISQIFVFYLSGLYSRIWKYTSLFDLYAILRSVATSSAIAFIVVVFVKQGEEYPRSVLLLYVIFNFMITAGSRLSIRVYYSHYYQDPMQVSSNPKRKLLLIGAGTTGEKIVKEILTTTSRKQYTIIGFLDDNAEKHGALLHGKKVFGPIKSLKNLKINFDEILITAPGATGDQMRRIVKICKESGKRYKTVPALGEIIDGELSIDVIRDVSYSDLLRRPEVKLDMNSIENMIQKKRVLITGAGGSIGLELVKQCLIFKPSEIICLDNNEESIHNINEMVKQVFPSFSIKTILASVISKKECEKVFIENRPQIVFHAAAYKHVPIQELHPWAAVKTNIGGTLNIVELSDKYGADKFVLVSTDKAVNPVNVMGATKRAAEKIIQSFNEISQTTYIAVRFGNVLGSSGSAIPTFQRQINSGGPITITHPEMTRYFMSIQEATQLILQCGALGKDGEIFLLEMGEPIKIVQMARDLIRLSGLEPDLDIPITYTGLRPGEKLYEELQYFGEQKVMTPHDKIMILKDSDSNIPWDVIKNRTRKLLVEASFLNSEKIQTILKSILPTYKPKSFNVSDDKFIRYGGIKGEA